MIQVRMSRTALFLLAILIVYLGLVFSLDLPFSVFFVLTTTIILSIQGVFFSLGMLHTWKDPKTPQTVTPPKSRLGERKRKFTLIIPARHEEKVIKQTLLAFSKIKYPQKLFEVLIVIREDDLGTIQKVKNALKIIKNKNFSLITFNGWPINKAKSLNIALKKARGEFVAIFDAEDEPNASLLAVINTFLDRNPKTDVIQSGVQLISVNSAWFSALACLEYYFWFKSVLPMFSYLGSTPLGGNTVFFRKTALERIGGWDEDCLTEDAEIGLRIAAAGYKTSMIYEESLATLEETPSDTKAFIKQRTRWIQGYLQTISRGYWTRQESFRKELLSFYLLLQPVIHQFLIILFVTGPTLAFFIKVPLGLSLISFLPLYFLILQLSGLIVGLGHLKKHYRIKFPISLYLKLILFYFPYQLMVGYSFLRAMKRILVKEFGWEKTAHFNQHRQLALSENIRHG